MNLLVTGSTGYIGREFVRHATAAGHVCTAVGRVLNVPPALAAIDWKSYGALVHLAAAGVRRVAPDRTWPDCIATNFEGTRNLLHSLSASGATPTVFISGSIREAQTVERPDYWSDPYIVSQKLRRLFVEEWAKGYAGRVVHPFCERCGDVADVDRLCADILLQIQRP